MGTGQRDARRSRLSRGLAGLCLRGYSLVQGLWQGMPLSLEPLVGAEVGLLSCVSANHVRSTPYRRMSLAKRSDYAGCSFPALGCRFVGSDTVCRVLGWLLDSTRRTPIRASIPTRFPTCTSISGRGYEEQAASKKIFSCILSGPIMYNPLVT